MEAKGKCQRIRCPYPHKGKFADIATVRDGKKFKKMEKNVSLIESTQQSNDGDSDDCLKTVSERTRYFDDGTSNNNNSDADNDLIPPSTDNNQTKLSRRILSKIDKMKANLNFCTGTTVTTTTKSVTSAFDSIAAAIITEKTAHNNDNLAMETNATDVVDMSGEVDDDDDEKAPPRKRPKLGKLPSYIPLD